MPVRKVILSGGRVGYMWGGSGKIYTGPNAQQQAARQGQAVYSAGYKGKTK
jgi:hypothetical protein